jgi:hypothetical protein
MKHQTEQLLEYLRDANLHADLARYTESVFTLTNAIGKVLHPAGFPSVEEYTKFHAQERPMMHINHQGSTTEQEELFQSSLQKARALAEKTGKTEIVTLIDDASSIKFGVNRVAQKANPEVVKLLLESQPKAASAPLVADKRIVRLLLKNGL